MSLTTCFWHKEGRWRIICVKDFESVINAFREDGNCSIFITGSNSYLLSGELVTKLTGRYVQVDMFPLAFDEFLAMKEFCGNKIGERRSEFDVYLTGGRKRVSGTFRSERPLSALSFHA